MKKAFRFDLNRCTACHACVLACQNENGLAPGSDWRQVHLYNEPRHPALPRLHLSLACNHCEAPACLAACPAAAYRQDEETGAVLLNERRCLGCTYCTWACPYDAPRYDAARGVVEKCTFCNERLAAGTKPACVTCCPTGALGLIERPPAAETPPVPGFSRTSLGPALQFVPLRADSVRPTCTAPPSAAAVERLWPRTLPKPPKKINLRSEWALLLFTTIAALLVALLASALTAKGRVRLPPLFFLGSGFLSMLLSTGHLGQKLRAWRAATNWRRSWLSREILLFSFFLGSSGLFLLIFPDRRWLGWTAAIGGFSALIAIDQVYRVALKVGPRSFHSAQVFFTGLYLTGILAQLPLLFIGAGAAKLLLYLERKARCRKHRSPLRLGMALVRLAAGFAGPLVLWTILGPRFSTFVGLAAALVIAGELVDRGEFYQDLEVLSPRLQILMDLGQALTDQRRT